MEKDQHWHIQGEIVTFTEDTNFQGVASSALDCVLVFDESEEEMTCPIDL